MTMIEFWLSAIEIHKRISQDHLLCTILDSFLSQFQTMIGLDGVHLHRCRSVEFLLFCAEEYLWQARDDVGAREIFAELVP